MIDGIGKKKICRTRQGTQTMKRKQKKENGRQEGRYKHTLLTTVPLILATSTILPPFPNRTICLATACAVMNTPVTLTSSKALVSVAEYSSAGVSCWIAAAAMRPSNRPSQLAISSTTALSTIVSRTSTQRYCSSACHVLARCWISMNSGVFCRS